MLFKNKYKDGKKENGEEEKVSRHTCLFGSRPLARDQVRDKFALHTCESILFLLFVLHKEIQYPFREDIKMRIK